MNIPIYRAKKIGRDDYAEGYILESSVIISKKNIAKDGFLPIIVEEIDIIDPSTLAISIDDGENFYSISFITRAIKYHIEATEIQQ